MKAKHTIKVNGVFYREGEEIPEIKKNIDPEEETENKENEPERKRVGRPPKNGE